MSTHSLDGSSASPSLAQAGSRRWAHRLALLLGAATVLLLAAGALVTSTGSSLAVPDWPLAYGELFPPMVGGILYEHGHRLIAASVGLLTVILAVWLWWTEPRAWVKWLGWGALGLVIFQGLLGGITVLFLLPKPVSISHALFAQLFFVLTIVLAQVTAPGWEWLVERPDARARPVAAWSLSAVLALLGQLLLGATVRHHGAGLAIPDFPLAYGGLIPPLAAFPIAIHFAHRVGAVLVLVLVGVCVWRVLRLGEVPSLRRPALAMAALVVAQVLLGGFVIWSRKSVEATTLHLVAGALLLGATALLALRAAARAGSVPGAGPDRASR